MAPAASPWPRPPPLGGPIGALATGRFDADPVPDLITSSFGANQVFTLRGDPSNGAVFRAPGAELSELSRNEDGTYTRRMTDGTEFVFDAAGLLLSRADRNGNTTAYAYDGQGLLISVTDPAGLVTGFDYAASTITDAAGRTTFYLLDADGNLINVTDPDSSVRQFAYDSNSRLIFGTSERGFTTGYDYGFAGQYLGSDLPDGSSIALDISRDLGLADLGIGLGTQANPAPFGRPENQMAELTDGNGNVTLVKLDEFGQPIEITDPIGRTTGIERNADGLATRITQPSDGELPDGSQPGQVVTELDYDPRGNVTARRQAVGTPLQRQTTFAYEPLFNQVTLITDPAGFETLFAYDPFGNLVTITDALGGQRSFTHDARGLVISQTDQSGNPTGYTYDDAGNLETVTDALATVTRQLHDAAGNVTTRIEAEGLPEERTTQATFDAMNRQTSATDGIGAVSLLAYDAQGNVIQTTDPTGVVTTQSFDQRNRLVEIENLATGASTRAYDPNGTPGHGHGCARRHHKS